MPRPDHPAPQRRTGRRRTGAARRGPGRWAAGAIAVALATGVWLVHDDTSGTGPPQPPTTAPDARPESAAVDVHGPTAPEPLPPSAPTRIRIRAIKVDAPLTGLGLDSARHLAAPPMENRNLVGWYRDGITPGARGTAIAVGHVDNRSGPAVFYRLGLLRPGDRIEVVRQDRRTAVFTIDSVRTFPKSAFPDETVYAPTPRPELRIITCGGHYDRHSGYQSNVVVFSHLSATA